ncbi:hypothetical protein L208DRAFT_1388693 [Tricholoma matsutake]|nr:hypothetical protein L208DRAFT_1388693 [Tricholoma matsutake 945]
MRPSLLTLFALALPCLALGSPWAEQEALEADGAVHTMEGWSYEDCGSSSDLVQIESIKVKPDPPQPGQDLTITVKANTTEIIEEGAYADVTVKLGVIKLLHKSFDLCLEAQNINATVQCPVEPGSYVVEQTVALPKEIPKAKFVVNVRAFTVDDVGMVCLDLKVDFMKRPFFKLGW